MAFRRSRVQISSAPPTSNQAGSGVRLFKNPESLTLQVNAALLADSSPDDVWRIGLCQDIRKLDCHSALAATAGLQWRPRTHFVSQRRAPNFSFLLALIPAGVNNRQDWLPCLFDPQGIFGISGAIDHPVGSTIRSIQVVREIVPASALAEDRHDQTGAT